MEKSTMQEREVTKDFNNETKSNKPEERKWGGQQRHSDESKNIKILMCEVKCMKLTKEMAESGRLLWPRSEEVKEANKENSRQSKKS